MCRVLPAKRERRKKASLHLDALTLVGLGALDLEVMLLLVVGPDIEVDPRPSIHEITEVAEKLLALILGIRLRQAALKCSKTLSDELSGENWDCSGEVVWLADLGVSLSSNDSSDLFVEVP